jgi:hypothetical protein
VKQRSSQVEARDAVPPTGAVLRRIGAAEARLLIPVAILLAAVVPPAAAYRAVTGREAHAIDTAVRSRRQASSALLRRLSAMRRIVIIGASLFAFAATAIPSAVAATSWPTTVDFRAVGPEAHITSFGVQHPRRFAYAPIPVGYAVTAWQVRWAHWGASSTLGRGRVQFCINMSPCHSGAFTLLLFRRRFVSCANGESHFGYTRVRLDVSKEDGGQPSTDTILVGC